jgi:hypothetical protein
MRGFKFSKEPEYEKTGFKEFKCQECKQKVQISGKKLMLNPPRWITRGQCKTQACVSYKLWITTRVEPATVLNQGGLAGMADHMEAIRIGEEE